MVVVWCVSQCSNSWDEWQILNRCHEGTDTPGDRFMYCVSCTSCMYLMFLVHQTIRMNIRVIINTCNICVCRDIIHSCKCVLSLIFRLSFFMELHSLLLARLGNWILLSTCTKETKWNRGRAVMSNSTYSVTYRPAAVWGSLLETMVGFERSGAF